jgi:hypothetical protein
VDADPVPFVITVWLTDFCAVVDACCLLIFDRYEYHEVPVLLASSAGSW